GQHEGSVTDLGQGRSCMHRLGRQTALAALLCSLVANLAPVPVAATQGTTPDPVVGVTTELPQTPGCTMVELQPGYPGYRGNVTGVMPHEGGTADYDCLETLEQLDPLFNRERQDRLNEMAATALGIEGPRSSGSGRTGCRSRPSAGSRQVVTPA
ncbi:MAG TPA: hypothetical protein VGW38_09700, partial [Chloroflexota bacterium]|nr:hypothetical protein [Chloroflexota bacterium]